MKENLIGFRKIENNGAAAAFAMIHCPKSPAILISADGSVIAGKMTALATLKGADDILFFVWAGQWRSDTFVISDDDLKNHYFPQKEKFDAETEVARVQNEIDKQKRKEERMAKRKAERAG